MRGMLAAAREGGYGIAMVNTFTFEIARGVLSAAEKLRAPIILGTAEALIPNAPLADAAAMLISMAKRSSVPVAVHLDHGYTPAVLEEALELGFTSVMYDCSCDAYGENVRKTREMARIAHAHGATIEAELGHVCFQGEGEEPNRYTDPRDARDFVEKTGVDALAVSIGTAHGLYREKPVLDIGRLRQIRDAVGIPLVLHGGSGLSDDDFRACVASGAAKINVFTDINLAGARAWWENYRPGRGIADISPLVIQAIREQTLLKLGVFGCGGRA